MATGARKVLLVTNIPTPYRMPLFNEIARQLADIGYRFKVVFAALGYERRKWQIDLDTCHFEHEVLKSAAFTLVGRESASFAYPGLFRVLRREQPDVVIVFGYSLATLKVLAWRWWRGTPYIIWSGAIEGPYEPASRARTLQRRILVRGASAFIAYGSRARDYLVGLGAPQERVHVAINTVDTEFFRRETAPLRGAGPGEEILAIGDLSERKGVDLLLAAFARLAVTRPRAILTLVGDGPERGALEAQAHALGIQGQVRFLGFKQRSEVPAQLARARCLAFPTRFDIWGLVLPEAMAAGIPCVVSVEAGAVTDLIEDGVNGFRVDFRQADVAADRLAWLMDNPDGACRLGEAASRFIRERATLPVSAAGAVAAVASLGPGTESQAT
jgi:glycosyltransferase involved in cell wall biosynthesis